MECSYWCHVFLLVSGTLLLEVWTMLEPLVLQHSAPGVFIFVVGTRCCPDEPCAGVITGLQDWVYSPSLSSSIQ